MNCQLARIKKWSPINPGVTLWIEMAQKQKLENPEGQMMNAYPTPYAISPVDFLYVEESIIDFLPFFAEVQTGRSITIIEELGGEVMVMGN